MMALYFIFSSIGKFFVLTLLVLVIRTTTTDASPIYRRQDPSSEADVREFKLWVKFAR